MASRGAALCRAALCRAALCRAAGAVSLAVAAGLVLAGLVFGGPARADSASPWVANDHARLRLISAVDSTGQQETLPLGVEFRMAPKWKIYWRSPGDAGYPPQLDWSGSSNLARADIAWPVPKRYSIFGLTTFVYQDTVVLPLTVTPQKPGAPLALRAHINYLLCDRICIPYEADLSLDLPAGEARPTEFSQTIDRSRAKVPRKVARGDSALGLTIERVLLTPDSGGGTLEVLARSAVPFSKLDLLAEGPSQLAFDAPRVALSEGDKLALLRIPVSVAGTKAAMPANPALTLTLIDGARAIEQQVTPISASGNQPDVLTLVGILGLALAGGFILNVMPCVLPVLSLKLLRAAGQAGRTSGRLRASFLATAAGIVVSILALGLAVIALKSAGLAVGWGVQFQQPVFLTVMALVVTLFAANLWGLFAISLPRVIGDAAAHDPDANHPAGRHSLSGDFATGVFATLLATPCSAPFLGTAIGFALTRGSGEILAVFSAIGLGLALPYLVVAAIPGLARLLPKPGRWMIGLRRLLGVVLAATAAWLISVLSVQVGWTAALVIAGVLVAVLLLLVLRRAAPGAAVRAASLYGVIALAVVALAVPLWSGPDTESPAEASRAWQPFDRVQIFNAVGQGKVVLVDVTADWCITCQANKALVLDRGEVRQRIEQGIEKGEMLALRADWTRPNQAIADYLASFGRFGIPFNAVYGPSAPSGIALPELLRAHDVLAAMDKAAGPADKTAEPRDTAAGPSRNAE